MREAHKFDYKIIAYKSNHEESLIVKILAKPKAFSGIVINSGVFTYYSFALHDVLENSQSLVVEVHLSNIKKCQPCHQLSVIVAACIKSIIAKKEKGYLEAVKIIMRDI